MVRANLPRCAVILFALSVTACDHLDRRETISLHGGNAAASNIAIHMIDPWPYAAGDRNIPADGERAAAAVERYRKNEVTEPRGMGTSALRQSGGER